MNAMEGSADTIVRHDSRPEYGVGSIDVKSSLAKSHIVRKDSPNNTSHASQRCAPRGVSFFLGIAMERSRS